MFWKCEYLMITATTDVYGLAQFAQLIVSGVDTQHIYSNKSNTYKPSDPNLTVLL